MIDIILKGRQLASPDATKYVFRHIQLPFLPATRDTYIEYEDGWGLSSIKDVYISLDGKVELRIDDFDRDDVKRLLATGHWFETIPKSFE